LRRRVVLALLLSVSLASGCVTIAGNALKDVEPSPPADKPYIEQTVGDFAFHLDGGKMTTSYQAGKALNEEIFKRWKEWGLISWAKHVKRAEFTGEARYHVTLYGTQDGRSSILLQILSGASLFALPYYVDTHYNLSLVVEEPATGKSWRAEVTDSYNTVVTLLLLPAAPFGLRGQKTTMDRIAANLYEQLRTQGAFGEAVGAVPPAP